MTNNTVVDTKFHEKITPKECEVGYVQYARAVVGACLTTLRNLSQKIFSKMVSWCNIFPRSIESVPEAEIYPKVIRKLLTG